MRIYHASNVVVDNPDTVHSRDYLDFGRGFYLTTIREQAEKYGLRSLRRGKTAWLNIYELSEDWNKWNVLHFNTYNKAWLDYIAKCRAGEPVDFFDLVIGGIANDRVIMTLDRYLASVIWDEYTENEKK